MLHTPGHSGQGCSFQLWGQGRPRPSPQPLFLCVPGHVDARQQVRCWSGPQRKGMHWLSLAV